MASADGINGGGRVRAEYVWLGLDSCDIRCKTRVLERAPTSVADLPDWNYDGSSTGQAPGNDSEVLIKPVAIFTDPFRNAPDVLVLCDTYKRDEPLPSNSRAGAKALFDKKLALKPWFGLEQEYTLFKDGRPLGWPSGSARAFGSRMTPTIQIGYPGPQGPYYCSAGADVAFGRDVAEAHLQACLTAGIKVSGINAEVMPGQWEFQIGPAEGIEAGDHLTMARYIMLRVGEKFGVTVTFEPKPVDGDWNGAGCHTNFSTEPMRKTGGLDIIKSCMQKLSDRHMLHMSNYDPAGGEENKKRMTGRHETAAFDVFSYGVGNRGASIRIPTQTDKDGYGYLEDRRPSANMDPYVVTSLLFETCCLI